MDMTKFTVVVMKHVRDFVQPAIDGMTKHFDDALAVIRSEFNEKLKAIPAGQKGDRGEKGDPGEKGQIGDVGAKGDAGERGEPGAKGIDGKDGEKAERGDQGDPGEKGDHGDAGEKGESGERGETGSAGVDGRVGEKGERGEKGDPGQQGEPGKPGTPGIDGKNLTLDDVRPLIEAMQAKWELDFERRAHEVLQRAIDRAPKAIDGKDGINGVDGLGFDDMAMEFDGERRIELRFQRGDVVKKYPITLPSLIDRGIFKDGGEYARGDCVTFAGSIWTAQKDMPDGKPGISTDWRLAVKRGRDGKDGTNGKDFASSTPVRLT